MWDALFIDSSKHFERVLTIKQGTYLFTKFSRHIHLNGSRTLLKLGSATSSFSKNAHWIDSTQMRFVVVATSGLR
jgi:hypothetical protein